ncbi:hypothetical protein CDG81_13515 [Actinopolyspora erythraea]|uniref:Glycosyltransferase family 1 protein n=1 Tax=Actinopolyspora erythraea TaxID=414996 RepID=A0A099D3J2_9ACTN|nr:hypothetical protein [Actinopolyspora erythraea]ASU81098.1 hypothetical protein CDG81_13515 [Actinopolyspora erythraea]KGI80589.1 hypothetical protein IL38_16280 [Actinopolyspora erythraea]
MTNSTGTGLRIGYSFWGFLGAGIIDTPDGGRSHRCTLVDALIAAGHEIVFLQANRDFVEAGSDLRGTYQWDERGLPELDLLFLEWRWPIAGRNTTPCGQPGHTCDLHRQQQLLDHYTDQGLPTILWDKDQQLPAEDPLRQRSTVTVAEAALHPNPGAYSLLFPVADEDLDAFDPASAAAETRSWPLVYVGNQYDRDTAFDTYFVPAAARHRHRVCGKWPSTDRWPQVQFTGRIPFTAVDALYRDAISTVLLLPERYTRRGQMTQRLFEAVLTGCLPLAPTTIRSVSRFVPSSLQVASGTDTADRVTRLTRLRTSDKADLLRACADRLELFRASAQLDHLNALLPAATRSVRQLAP